MEKKGLCQKLHKYFPGNGVSYNSPCVWVQLKQHTCPYCRKHSEEPSVVFRRVSKSYQVSNHYHYAPWNYRQRSQWFSSGQRLWCDVIFRTEVAVVVFRGAVLLVRSDGGVSQTMNRVQEEAEVFHMHEYLPAQVVSE